MTWPLFALILAAVLGPIFYRHHKEFTKEKTK